MVVPGPVLTVPAFALGMAQGSKLEALAVLLRTLALLTMTSFGLDGGDRILVPHVHFTIA